MGEVVKKRVWDDRRGGFRLAGGAAAVAATVGGQKAGLAMLETAVAVPLWVVFGAGAAFAGQGRGCASPGEAPRQFDRHTPTQLAPAEEPKALRGSADPDAGGGDGDLDGPMDFGSRHLPHPLSMRGRKPPRLAGVACAAASSHDLVGRRRHGAGHGSEPGLGDSGQFPEIHEPSVVPMIREIFASPVGNHGFLFFGGSALEDFDDQFIHAAIVA